MVELAELQRKREELHQRAILLSGQEQQLEASARARLDLAAVAGSIEAFCARVSAGLAEATFEEQRALVELLIDRVVVTGDTVEIRSVVPTSPDGPHYPFCMLRLDYLHRLPRRVEPPRLL